MADGEINAQRNLTQYTNPSSVSPEVGDLIVFSGTFLNRFGLVAIISDVSETEVEIIQQNPGPFTPSRERFTLKREKNNHWKVEQKRVLGWLSKSADHEVRFDNEIVITIFAKLLLPIQ